MKRKLYPIEEVKNMIQEGRKLILTGDETALNKLPEGQWIGGTIPYFMDENEGKFTKEMVFVDDFTDLGTNFKVSTYTTSNIHTVAEDGFENGIIMLIIPAGTECHTEYSLKSLNYNDIFKNPVVGFISGFDLDLIESAKAGVYAGNGSKNETGAVALHIELPADKVARVEIVNIFDQKVDSDTITFVENGFTQKDCIVNGEKMNLVEYFDKVNFSSQQPLTNDKGGAIINTCIQEVNKEAGTVSFYGPIFTDTEYKISLPVDNYEAEFEKQQPKDAGNIRYACNCILNYLYGELQGKKTPVTATATFGEIAYQLLNQTMVYLVIDDAA